MEALQAQVPDDNEPLEVRRAFVNQIQAVWFNALRLNPAWVKLSEAEVKALENYLYANELLVRCKEAAVRVSPQTWAGIEARMLTVQDGD